MVLRRAILALLAIRVVVANEEVSITFKPGVAGLSIVEERRFYSVVDLSDDGQAEQLFPEKELSVPATILKVNGEDFSYETFAKAESSNESYTITFKQSYVADLPKSNSADVIVAQDDCSGWDSGNCKTCSSWKETLRTQRAKCLTCHDGWAVIDGSPSAETKYFTDPTGENFVWIGHCAEIDPATEKRVIMIRHGLSTWNEVMETSKLFGLAGLFVYKDSPLAPTGLRQVQRLAQIISKANAATYPDDTGPSDAVKSSAYYEELEGARAELGKVTLEDKIHITESGKRHSDDSMVQNLTKQENRLELDILTGRKCDETVFVSSPLARAFDTLLIGTMERSMRCTTKWEISSNLQELEHNKDCEPDTSIRSKPTMVKDQRAQYQKIGIGKTADMVTKLYKTADPERHTIIRGAMDRSRLNDHADEMIEELETTMASPKKYRVWAGHSIWFRHFFRHFADQSETECRRMGKVKMANTAMISFRLRRLKSKDSPRKFVVDDCKFIHLHADAIFKVKEGKDEL